MQCEYYALEGLSDLVADDQEGAREPQSRSSKSTACCARCTTRAIRSRSRFRQQLEQHFGDKVYRTLIPRNVRLAEAPSYGVPALLCDAAPKARRPIWRSPPKCSLNGVRSERRMTMAKLKGLGRGLDALLGGDERPRRRATRWPRLPVARLQPGKYQPRTQMDRAGARRARRIDHDAGRDAADAGAAGRPAGATRSSRASAAGARRSWPDSRRCRCWCAMCPTRRRSRMALIENIQREDLNPLEEAAGHRSA